jgi:hypothetical protein
MCTVDLSDETRGLDPAVSHLGPLVRALSGRFTFMVRSAIKSLLSVKLCSQELEGRGAQTQAASLPVKHGPLAEQVPVSAYVGSSKNLKDLKDHCTPLEAKHQRGLPRGHNLPLIL